jgi:hypothetical protein
LAHPSQAEVNYSLHLWWPVLFGGRLHLPICCTGSLKGTWICCSFLLGKPAAVLVLAHNGIVPAVMCN